MKTVTRYYFLFYLIWKDTDINGVAQNFKILFMTEDNNNFTAKPERERKAGLGFRANLFCVNWQFANTCDRSVSYTI